jgi:fucose 4-O-acetylase-like acetyltransferase
MGAHSAPRTTAPDRSPAPAAASDPAGAAATGRDRYFDALRALALVRVVTYHCFGWAWLGFVFPSMGVMFALAGSLMARSLRRPALQVIRSRLRRLLVPFWLWGVCVVLAMAVHGWMPGWTIVYWVVPLGDPPGNAWGEQAWEILWYLRCYLWFVLLSPPLLWLLRRVRLPLLPLSLVPILLIGTDTVPLPGADGRLGSAVTDFSIFLFCWLLGLAHHEGMLRRWRPAPVVVLSLAALAAGAWYALTHQGTYGTYDLDDVPLAQALWSAGFVTLLMYGKTYARVDLAGLSRHRRLDRIVTVFNARAMTVYLWHEIALVVAVPLIDLGWDVPAFEKWLPLESQWFLFAVGWALLALAVPLFGWVEDLAARRPVRLLP